MTLGLGVAAGTPKNSGIGDSGLKSVPPSTWAFRELFPAEFQYSLHVNRETYLPVFATGITPHPLLHLANIHHAGLAVALFKADTKSKHQETRHNRNTQPQHHFPPPLHD